MDDYIAEASRCRLIAVIYLENAKIIEESFVRKNISLQNNRMGIPYYGLISHAFEMILKCSLLKRGLNPTELKTLGLRHNLIKMIQTIAAQGVSISSETNKTISVLSDQHEEHLLRYKFLDEDTPVYMPSPKQLYEAFNEILQTSRLASHEV